MTRRRLCIILDVLMLLAIGGFVVWLVVHTPKSHIDVDRSQYPIKGIDISAHNADVDFIKVIGDTVTFVMLKATEGTDFCDAKFNINYQEASKVGLKVGAYHFFRFDSPGEAQANHFLNTVSGRTFELPLAIDVETWGNPDPDDQGYVREQLRAMVDIIHSAGYPLMIYTNKKGYGRFIEGSFDDVPLWICSLSSSPAMDGWHLWQHSHESHVEGINGFVDLNTYNGDTELFNQWTRRYTIGGGNMDTVQ